MAHWSDQIQDMAGVLANSESVATHMANGVKDVVNKLARINPGMMHLFSGNENNASGNGYVAITDNNMILKVARREGSVYRTCIEAPISMEADLTDATSLNKATTEYPRFIRLNSKIYVYPTITTANYISVTKVKYGTVNNLTGSSDGTIDNFPDGMYPMVVCYASMHTLLEKMAEILVAGNLQNIGTMEIDGNPITTATWNDDSDAKDAELENPKYYFSTLRHFINSEEDVELSRAQVEKITAYLSWYQTSIEHNKTNYTWMFERMRQLKENYNEYFLPYMPEQKQEQQEPRDG
tara:strand:- start:129 stop:1013 length:885 start_codon:yes stop_codon:yes gene_type:complete